MIVGWGSNDDTDPNILINERKMPVGRFLMTNMRRSLRYLAGLA
jgi:hypothetical protein